MIDHYDVAVPGGPAVPLPMGERRLLLATLQDALRTLLGIRYGSRRSKYQREDLEWLMSEDDGDPFTYVRICAALGIDAGWLRGRVVMVTGDHPGTARSVARLIGLAESGALTGAELDRMTPEQFDERFPVVVNAGLDDRVDVVAPVAQDLQVDVVVRVRDPGQRWRHRHCVHVR